MGPGALEVLERWVGVGREEVEGAGGGMVGLGLVVLPSNRTTLLRLRLVTPDGPRPGPVVRRARVAAGATVKRKVAEARAGKISLSPSTPAPCSLETGRCLPTRFPCLLCPCSRLRRHRNPPTR